MLTILINFLSIVTFHFISVVRKQSVLSFALDSVSDPTCCVVQWAVDIQLSGWITVVHLVEHYFDLSIQEFCDAL